MGLSPDRHEGGCFQLTDRQTDRNRARWRQMDNFGWWCCWVGGGVGWSWCRKQTYPRVLMKPLTEPSAYRDTMSPMWRKLDLCSDMVVVKPRPARPLNRPGSSFSPNDKLLPLHFRSQLQLHSSGFRETTDRKYAHESLRPKSTRRSGARRSPPLVPAFPKEASRRAEGAELLAQSPPRPLINEVTDGSTSCCTSPGTSRGMEGSPGWGWGWGA